MTKSLNEKLREIVLPIAEKATADAGCYLYDLEMVGGGDHRALRVTIDRDVEGGISVDDCANVSRSMSEALDALEGTENEIPGGGYQLEVSSPGLERALKQTHHFQRAIGKTILVRSLAPLVEFNPQRPQLDKAKQAQGRLLSFDSEGVKLSLADIDEGADQDVVILSDADTVFVPFSTITKAHVVASFGSKESKPGKHHKPKGKAKK